MWDTKRAQLMAKAQLCDSASGLRLLYRLDTLAELILTKQILPVEPQA